MEAQPSQRENPNEPKSVHDYLYTPRDPVEDRLLTTIGLAGDALAHASEDETEKSRVVTAHAKPVENKRPAFFEDYEDLLEIVAQFHSWLEADPRRGEFLNHLRAAFGDGEALPLLFRRLFPGQEQPTPSIPGELSLTRRHLEILREAAAGYSQSEIGKRLHIKENTVNAHFQTIYRRTGANRPLQAVAVAISKGLLPLSVGEFVLLASGCGARNFSAFDTFLSYEMREASVCPGAHLAELGLFFLTLSGTAAAVEQSKQEARRGCVCELDAHGNVIRALENKRLAQPRMLAVASPAAAQHGYKPGNLFVCHENFPMQGLNRGEVLEFTPAGELVNAFCGGKDLGTRLAYVPGLLFTRSGKLLVASSVVTDRILAFEAGGRVVRAWADTNLTQMCADSEGNIYVAQYSSAGCQVKVFSEFGKLLRPFAHSEAGIGYMGIAINSRGEVCVHQVHGETSEIVVYSREGEWLRSFQCPRSSPWRIAIDAQDRVYVCCEQTCAIRVFSSHGEPLRVFPLRGIKPNSITLTENGRMWVCGTLTPP